MRQHLLFAALCCASRRWYRLRFAAFDSNLYLNPAEAARTPVTHPKQADFTEFRYIGETAAANPRILACEGCGVSSFIGHSAHCNWALRRGPLIGHGLVAHKNHAPVPQP